MATYCFVCFKKEGFLFVFISLFFFVKNVWIFQLLINIALGFDSYVVLRHGIHDESTTSPLGCYFCNDVVAPQNVNFIAPFSFLILVEKKK